HTHTPAFLFNGNIAYNGSNFELYRVYVFTDSSCVNQVFRGAVVGSPAYSPRPTGPLALPSSADALATPPLSSLPHAAHGNTFSADLQTVKTSEASDATSSDSAQGAAVDLWDSGWPSGRYYWTVIPVKVSVETGGAITYRDMELPQEACSSGRVGSFGKLSDP